jgi:hypothetical protein
MPEVTVSVYAHGNHLRVSAEKLISEVKRLNQFCDECRTQKDFHETRNRVGEPISRINHSWRPNIDYHLADLLEKALASK